MALAMNDTGRHTEEDKSLTCASRESSVESCGIEADISTADSDDAGFASESDMQTTSETEGPCMGNTLPEDAAQRQLEMMSQLVMDAWTRLRALESALPDGIPGEATIDTAMPVRKLEQRRNWRKRKGKSPMLNVKSCLCGSGDAGPSEHAEALLTTVKGILDATSGVAGTTIVLGNVATLFVDLLPDSPELARLSVSVISKSAILEAAKSTDIVYILGYEALPFQDNVSGTGYAGTIAIMPPGKWNTACWDTFTQGLCPRGAKCGAQCKWRHPGRAEIQPLQVVFR